MPTTESPDWVRKPETESGVAGLGYSCKRFSCQLPFSAPVGALDELPPPHAANVNTTEASNVVVRILTDLSEKTGMEPFRR